MATMIKDSIEAARNVLDSAKETTAHAVGAAESETKKAVSKARFTLGDAIKTALEGASLLRGLGIVQALSGRGPLIDHALASVGLRRRGGGLESVALFGAGMVLGAGIGVLYAPASGAETRRAIRGWLERPAKSPTPEASKPVVAEEIHLNGSAAPPAA